LIRAGVSSTYNDLLFKKIVREKGSRVKRCGLNFDESYNNNPDQDLQFYFSVTVFPPDCYCSQSTWRTDFCGNLLDYRNLRMPGSLIMVFRAGEDHTVTEKERF
jgi:hypothetical protein